MRYFGLTGGRVRRREGGGTYPIDNSATHRGDQSDTTSVPKANHLLGHCLRGHEHTGDVDFEHGVAVFGGILQCRGLLLDTRGSNETVHAAFLVGDALDHAVEEFCVTYVDTTVMQLGAEFLCAPLDLDEFGSLM
jgi:hypothetical protein